MTMPMYLTINGITGECQDTSHVGKSVVFRYNWEAMNPNPYPSSNGGIDGLVFEPLRVLRTKDCNVGALLGMLNEKKMISQIIFEEFLTNNNVRKEADFMLILGDARIKRIASGSLGDIPVGTPQAMLPASVEWIEFDYRCFFIRSFSSTSNQSTEYGWDRLANQQWTPSK